MKNQITIETTINTPVEKVWNYFTNPEHIIHWNYASEDWHTPKTENDLQVGGKYFARMEAKDGSAGFDLIGTYTTVEEFKKTEYIMGDRKVINEFISQDDGNTKVIITFDAEEENPLEFQKAGWQAILDNFKAYVTSH